MKNFINFFFFKFSGWSKLRPGDELGKVMTAPLENHIVDIPLKLKFKKNHLMVFSPKRIILKSVEAEGRQSK